MKWIALALLAGAAVVYALASVMQARHPAWGYVAAFSEAAMVGALADWFAVTALFRHPLGLPIPHTALIPARKDEIGRSLGAFVSEQFLAPDLAPDLAPVERALGRPREDLLGLGDRRGHRAGPQAPRRDPADALAAILSAGKLPGESSARGRGSGREAGSGDCRAVGERRR